MAKFDTTIDKSYGEMVKEQENKDRIDHSRNEQGGRKRGKEKILTIESEETDREKITAYDLEFSSGASASEKDSGSKPASEKSIWY